MFHLYVLGIFVYFSFKLGCYIQVSILKLHTMKILFTVYWLSCYPNIMIVDLICKQKYYLSQSYCALINIINQKHCVISCARCIMNAQFWVTS